MAGKTKRSGSRPGTPKKATPREELPGKGQLGHMGLKSSPYAPTDCKLVNQYMVRDRMQAHYKKLHKTKAAVDTSAPKAWLVSQKMRDQARREAMCNSPRKSAFLARQSGLRSSRPGSVGSEDDRVEMLAMMESLSHMEEGDLDELDGHQPRRANTSMEIHHSDSSTFNHVGRTEMQFVNKMVQDSERSPSKYYTGKSYQSNIPSSSDKRLSSTRVVAQKPLYRTQVLETYQSNVPLGYTRVKPSTPRSGDVLEQNAYKFTEEKPFQPRTLKSNRKSKLSEFKYYTAPKRKDTLPEEEADIHGNQLRPDTAQSTRAPSMRTSMRSRPGTANTMNSTDWMNETIISRDHTERDTPQGVPALDISLDQDHLKWIKEQQTKAQFRLSAKSPHSDLGSTRGSELADTQGMNGTLGRSAHLGTFTLQASVKDTGYHEQLTARKIQEEEEELKYLQFIQDVTNDVLDRGIFTNRVLKVVFESHVERRKHELKVSKMREMLEDLRIDLGIPASAEEDDPEGLGLTSTWSPLRSSSTHNPRASRRTRHDTRQFGSTDKPNLPSLHHSVPPPRPGRTPSPEGKPPLPRPNSRGSKSPTRSFEKIESRDENTVTDVAATEAKSADILTIEHDVAQDDATVGEFMKSGESAMMNSTLKCEGGSNPISDDEDQAALYEKQLAHTLDDEDRLSLSGSESGRRDHSVGHSARETDRTDYSDHSDFDEKLDTKNFTATRVEDSITDNELFGDSEGKMTRTNDQSEGTEKVPKPTPRRRKGSEPKDTARSHDKGNTTTDTIDVSDLDEEEYDTF